MRGVYGPRAVWMRGYTGRVPCGCEARLSVSSLRLVSLTLSLLRLSGASVSLSVPRVSRRAACRVPRAVSCVALIGLLAENADKAFSHHALSALTMLCPRAAACRQDAAAAVDSDETRNHSIWILQAGCGGGRAGGGGGGAQRGGGGAAGVQRGRGQAGCKARRGRGGERVLARARARESESVLVRAGAGGRARETGRRTGEMGGRRSGATEGDGGGRVGGRGKVSSRSMDGYLGSTPIDPN